MEEGRLDDNLVSQMPPNVCQSVCLMIGPEVIDLSAKVQGSFAELSARVEG